MSDFSRDLITHLPALTARAFKLTGDRSATQDLVQDVIERALRKQAQFTPGTNLSAWLMTILRNMFFTSLRRDSREMATDPQSDSFTSHAVPPPQDQVVLLAETVTAMRRLRPEHRLALGMAVDGLRMDAAARAQGIAEGTAKSRLSRARQHLDILLSQPIGDARMTRARRTITHPLYAWPINRQSPIAPQLAGAMAKIAAEHGSCADHQLIAIGFTGAEIARHGTEARKLASKLRPDLATAADKQKVA